MTNYEFEKIVKQTIIQIFGENINIDKLDFVWFTHELGYKKCIIWDSQWIVDMWKLFIIEIKIKYMQMFIRKIINNKILFDEFLF